MDFSKYKERGTFSQAEIDDILSKNRIQVHGECYETIINQRHRLSMWAARLGDDSIIYNVDCYTSPNADSLDMDRMWEFGECELIVWFDQRDDALGFIHAVAMDSVHWDD